jgi:outer membrane protein, adhesin transport system
LIEAIMGSRQAGMAFLAIMAVSLGHSSAKAQTLLSAVRQTLQTNPELQSLRYNRLAIDQELEAAKGLGLPSVDVRAGISHRATDQSREARGTTLPPGYRSRNRAEAGIVATQRLFDGFETKHQVERQGNRVESARNRVLDTANSVALQAVQAHLEVLRAQRVREVAQRNVERHQALLNKVQDRVGSGKGPSSEINQAQARLNAAKAALGEADGRLRDGRSLYNAVVGRQPGKLMAATAPYKALPKTVDQAVMAAKKGSPAIIARMFDGYAAEAAIGVARAEFMPKLNLELSADYSLDADKSNGRRTDLSAMLMYRQNLYRGGIDTARTREATNRALEAHELTGQAMRSVERDVRVSWSAIQTATLRAGAIDRQLQNNRQVVAAYNEQFDLGQRTLLDILDIQNEIFVNETVLETERFVADFNVYRVVAAMGKLVSTLGLSNPDEGKFSPDYDVRLIPKGAL